MVSEFERSRGIRPGGGTGKGERGLALMMKLRVRLAALGLVLFSSCSMNYAFAKNAPYALQAKMVTEPSAIYEAAGLDFTFLNKDSQKVKSITLVFLCMTRREIRLQLDLITRNWKFLWRLSRASLWKTAFALTSCYMKFRTSPISWIICM